MSKPGGGQGVQDPIHATILGKLLILLTTDCRGILLSAVFFSAKRGKLECRNHGDCWPSLGGEPATGGERERRINGGDCFFLVLTRKQDQRPHERLLHCIRS